MTFHKYIYNCNGSISIRRSVLLYVAKKLHYFNIFFSKIVILRMLWVRTGYSVHLMWKNDSLSLSVLDVMIHSLYCMCVLWKLEEMNDNCRKSMHMRMMDCGFNALSYSICAEIRTVYILILSLAFLMCTSCVIPWLPFHNLGYHHSQILGRHLQTVYWIFCLHNEPWVAFHVPFCCGCSKFLLSTKQIFQKYMFVMKWFWGS
jgi:hypothetical protein